MKPFNRFEGPKGSKQDRFLESSGIVKGPNNKKVIFEFTFLLFDPFRLANENKKILFFRTVPWQEELFHKSKQTRWYTYCVGPPLRRLTLAGTHMVIENKDGSAGRNDIFGLPK